MRLGRFLPERVSDPNSCLVVALNILSLPASPRGFFQKKIFSGQACMKSAIVGQTGSLVDHLPA